MKLQSNQRTEPQRNKQIRRQKIGHIVTETERQTDRGAPPKNNNNKTETNKNTTTSYSLCHFEVVFLISIEVIKATFALPFRQDLHYWWVQRAREPEYCWILRPRQQPVDHGSTNERPPKRCGCGYPQRRFVCGWWVDGLLGYCCCCLRIGSGWDRSIRRWREEELSLTLQLSPPVWCCIKTSTGVGHLMCL